MTVLISLQGFSQHNKFYYALIEAAAHTAFQRGRRKGRPIPYTLSYVEWPRLPFTARIERAQFHRARSASKKGTWPFPCSIFQRSLIEALADFGRQHAFVAGTVVSSNGEEIGLALRKIGGGVACRDFCRERRSSEIVYA